MPNFQPFMVSNPTIALGLQFTRPLGRVAELVRPPIALLTVVMYFWRIEKLKAEMAARPLSERQVLPYLVVFVGLFAAVGYIPGAVTNVWDGLEAVWSVALAVFGTIYIYRQNGGAGGQHFLQRYFAIGWVVTIRWLVILVLVAVAFFTLITVLERAAEETTWYEFLFLAVVEAVVYWRIGYHVRDLAHRTKAV